MKFKIPLQQYALDNEFQLLIRPLYKQEYTFLEENILSAGCHEPVQVWKGKIINGQNQYEICMKHGIPFPVEQIYFDWKEEAAAWICKNQLKRRNLPDEMRRFLIGMQYEYEKTVYASRIANGYIPPLSGCIPDRQVPEFGAVPLRRIAQELSDSYHISDGALQKYTAYARAVKKINEIDSKLTEKILSGKYRISIEHTVILSRKTPDEIKAVGREAERSQQLFVQHPSQRKLPELPVLNSSQPSVKDMPAFDPDAEIVGLTLTVPSWISSINRIRNSTTIPIATGTAKEKLRNTLIDLQHAILDMLMAIKEK